MIAVYGGEVIYQYSIETVLCRHHVCNAAYYLCIFPLLAKDIARGVNSGGDGGDASPPEFGVGGTLM